MVKETSYEAPHFPFFSVFCYFLFGPNIILSILFSNTLSLCSFLDVRDKVNIF
jgi:hypothetical protein